MQITVHLLRLYSSALYGDKNTWFHKMLMATFQNPTCPNLAEAEESYLRTENAILRAESKILAERTIVESEQRRALEQTLAATLQELEKVQDRNCNKLVPVTSLPDASTLEGSLQELHDAVANLVDERARLRCVKCELEKQVSQLTLENKALLSECQSLRKQLSASKEIGVQLPARAAKTASKTRDKKGRRVISSQERATTSWVSLLGKAFRSKVRGAASGGQGGSDSGNTSAQNDASQADCAEID